MEDAFTKASRTGTSYYFTWNVCEFVLFETHREGVPFMERRVEGPIHVADVTTSDDVQRNDVQNAVKDFWERFLVDLAALEQGRRRLQDMPLDQRFVRRVEAALEEPIAATGAALLEHCRTDLKLKTQLRTWMVTEQGWEDVVSRFTKVGQCLAVGWDGAPAVIRTDMHAWPADLIEATVTRAVAPPQVLVDAVGGFR